MLPPVIHFHPLQYYYYTSGCCLLLIHNHVDMAPIIIIITHVNKDVAIYIQFIPSLLQYNTDTLQSLYER